MGHSGAPSADTHSDPARHLGTMRVLLVALGAVSALIMLAGTAGSLWRMRSGALEEAETRLADLSLVLAEQTDRAVDQIDLVLQGAVEEATRAAATASLAPVPALHEALAAQLRSARAPQLGALGLVGADGDLVAFSGAFPPPKLDYGDRDHFRAHRDGPPARLFIGVPQRARLLQGELGVPFSKRIERPDGAFAGTAFAVARMPYFVDLYSALKLGPGSMVRLFRRDSVLLASFPAAEGTAGKSFADSALFREVPPEGGTAVVREGGPDGSIVAMRTLPDYGLVVAVSAPEAQVLAAWRRDTWIFGALAVLAAAFVVGLAFAVERRLAADARLRDELREGTARLDAIVRSAMDAIITVDAEQRIVLFNGAAERMFGIRHGRRSARRSSASSPSGSARCIAGTWSASAAPARPRAAWAQQQPLWAAARDGTEFPIDASISQAVVGGQQLLTVILRDITERLTAEREIALARVARGRVAARGDRAVGDGRASSRSTATSGSSSSTPPPRGCSGAPPGGDRRAARRFSPSGSARRTRRTSTASAAPARRRGGWGCRPRSGRCAPTAPSSRSRRRSRTRRSAGSSCSR